MNGRKILIVEDSPTERHVLAELFSRRGYRVSTANDGEAALTMARAELPDVILMDVVMPGTNGYQATRTLSRDPLTRHIPIVLCSSKDQEADRIWGMRQGARDYLVKPLDPDRLVASIEALL